MPGNRILATFGTGEVGLIDVATKTFVWKVWGFNGDSFQSPYDAELLPDGNLAVALRFNNGGRISVYNLTTGEEVWKHYLSNAHSVHFRTAGQSYNTDDPTLLVGGWGNIREVAYRPSGGQNVTWQVKSEYTHDAIVVENDRLITTEGYYVQKIDRVGTKLWKKMTPDEDRRIAVNPNAGRRLRLHGRARVTASSSATSTAISSGTGRRCRTGPGSTTRTASRSSSTRADRPTSRPLTASASQGDRPPARRAGQPDAVSLACHAFAARPLGSAGSGRRCPPLPAPGCAGGCRTVPGGGIDHDARPDAQRSRPRGWAMLPGDLGAQLRAPGRLCRARPLRVRDPREVDRHGRGRRVGRRHRRRYARRGLCAGRLIVSSSSTSRANRPHRAPCGVDRCLGARLVPGPRRGLWRQQRSDVPVLQWLPADRRRPPPERFGRSLAPLRRRSRLLAVRAPGNWISLNSWHRVVVHVRAGWSAGRVDVFIDGVLAIHATARTTCRPAASRRSWLEPSTSARRWT